MIAEILKSSLSGKIKAPPSKSMAHRLIICACLSEGNSVVSGLDSLSEDIKATAGCMNELGAKTVYSDESFAISGIDIMNARPKNALFVNESGSTLRFLIPLCLLTGERITLEGSKRLFERPLAVYEKICKDNGFLFEKGEGKLTLCGNLKPGVYEVPGDISSQFISGLLFALPLLSGDSTVKITGNLESRSYILMTLSALSEFGVDVEFTPHNELLIKGGQKYVPKKAVVEGDYSNAAFFEALNYFGHSVKVEGLCETSLQGDKVYKEYFEKLDKGYCTLNLEDCPDLAPVLMAVAAEKHGACFTGTKRLKIKESDRAEAMREELEKLGCALIVEENSVKVEKCSLCSPVEPINSHKDHRIVMALSVMLTKYGGKVNNCEDVAKSLPDFFDRIKSLGAKVNLNED